MARIETIIGTIDFDSKGIVVITEETDLGQFSLLQLNDWLEDKRLEANRVIDKTPAPLYSLWQKVSAHVRAEERKERQKQKQ